MSEMMKLAEIVEGLEGADTALDLEIWRALHPGCKPTWGVPSYSASLDAARQLVPTTCLFWCRELWDDQRKAGFAGVNIYRDMMHAGEIHGLAATPALALTAAALKARAHLEGE